MMKLNQKLESSTMHLETPYGTLNVKEPVLKDLIKSPSMQRLHAINQYGITPYLSRVPSFSRYDHSVGVLFLLHKYECSLPEQIAGLLHDVSHTVFSHVGDFIFAHKSIKNSYQDDIHEWFINQTELAQILLKHGFSVKDILHKQKSFKALEQDLPNLCADRLEYNLQGALVEKKFTPDDIDAVLKSLHYANGMWFFDDVEQAKKLSLCALYLQQYVYTSAYSSLVNNLTGAVLRRALAVHELTYDDIHFSTDKNVLAQLEKSEDHEIKQLMHTIKNAHILATQGTAQNYEYHFAQKFRGIDPYVSTKNGMKLLSSIDEEYCRLYRKVKQCAKQGWYVSLRKTL